MTANPAPLLRTAARPAKAPGPRGNLLLEYRRDAPRMLLRLQQEYGGIVRFRLGPLLVHQVTHPDLVRQVLVTEARTFPRGRFYRAFEPFFGRAMLTADGEQWRRHRDVSRPLFHPARVQEMGPTMTATAVELADRLTGLARRQAEFDVVPEAIWYTMAVVSRCLFTTDFTAAGDRLVPAANDGVELILERTNPLVAAVPRWLPTRHNRRLRASQRVLQDVLADAVEEHRREPGDDLIHAYLAAADGTRPPRLSDVDARDGIMTVFLAGNETTGSSLAWTLYVLASRPEVLRRVETEAERVLAGRPPTLADLPELEYTRMVVEESLRLYPPIWAFPRGVAEDVEIGGFHVPAGSSLFLSPYVTHRHPGFWKNPEVFDPERFRPDLSAARDRHSYLPFGFGQRQCIGKHLALLQLQLAVATLAQRVRLQLVPGAPVTYHATVSLRPWQPPRTAVTMTAHERT
jgi:cytochrome P450